MDDKYLEAVADEWHRLGHRFGLVPISSTLARAIGGLFDTAATRAFSDETGPAFDAVGALTIGKTREEFAALVEPETDDEAYWRSVLNDPQGRVPNDEDMVPGAY